MRFQIPLIAVSLLLLGACASVPKRVPRESGLPPMPDRYRAAPEPVPETRSLELVLQEAWWTRFGDARLDALVQEALEANSNLEQAAARVEAAEARAKIAGAELKPVLGAGLRGSRSRQNFIGLPVPGGSSVLSTTTTSHGLSLDASWEVDLWGRLRAGKRAALADLGAAQADWRGARESLAAQVAKVWFSLLEAHGQVELARETLESYGSSADSIRQRYEAGLTRALDMRLALSNVAGAEARLALALNREDSLARQLEILLGRYPAAELKAVGVLPDCPTPIPSGLPAELVERRPDLVAAEARVLAADSRIRAARRALYPSFSLSAGGGTSSDSLRDLLSGDFRVWSLAGNLLAPLFNGGRLRAGVSLANAGEHQAFADFVSSTLSALGEVETALGAERHLAMREAALAEDVRHATAARELADRQYAGGLSDIITLLEARRRALAAQSQWLTARLQRLETRIDLHLALGGGFGEEQTSSTHEDAASNTTEPDRTSS